MLLVYSLSIAQNNGIESPQALEFIMLSLIVITAFFLIEYRSKMPLMPLGFLKKRFNLWCKRVGLDSDGCICSNDIHFNKLFSTNTRLFCFIYRHCISPYEYSIFNHFRVFVIKIGKPLWCQTHLNFRDGFADCRIPISFANIYNRKLL